MDRAVAGRSDGDGGYPMEDATCAGDQWLHGAEDGGGDVLHHGLEGQGGDRGCHRAEDGHRPGGSTCVLGRRRPRSEEPPDRGGFTRPRLHRCGPNPSPGENNADPVGSVVDLAPSLHVSSVVEGSSMSAAGSSGGAAGPTRCDAPRRRVRQRRDDERRAHGDCGSSGLPRARGGRPAPRQRGHPQGQTRQAVLDAPGTLQQQPQPTVPGISDSMEGNLPGLQPPTWLYLPHLGIGCGTAIGSTNVMDNLRSRAEEEGEAGLPRGHADHGGSPRRGPIRGRVDSGMQPPGPARDCHTPAAMRDGQIRGRAAPGAADGRSAAEARAEARLAAQHAPLRRSLEDHAERVAKRQRCGGTPIQPSPAARLAAVRARVAARAAQAQTVHAGSGGDAAPTDGGTAVDPAVAHAAARAAHHGVVHSNAD